ncbi:MAG: hypothetical protein BWX70_03203 [Verrucomicrobia bacterium ADurb.Bin070]|nr:MAG: hypothetical protein BWX70_03203 [Verrucomicrobia bacterium ADurb.Bin070]
MPARPTATVQPCAMHTCARSPVAPRRSLTNQSPVIAVADEFRLAASVVIVAAKRPASTRPAAPTGSSWVMNIGRMESALGMVTARRSGWDR